MGVDPTPRAKYRRGELRLVLGLPEPWTEAQRDDFLKAVEGISAVAGVAAGDVSVQSALLTSWNPSDEQPAGVITSADVEKLIIKFGLDEPRLRKEVADEAYRSGRISCERGHDDVKAAYFKSGAEGKLCDLETCFDFHYVNDGSPHRFVNPEQTSKPMFAEADEDEDDDYSRADEGWGTED